MVDKQTFLEQNDSKRKQTLLSRETDEVLIPYDPSKVYTETEAIALTAFAGTYRDVRGKAQLDRFKKKQKAQKNAKGTGKSQKKSVSKPRSFAFKKWRKPRTSDSKAKTAYKDRTGPTTLRGKASNFLKRVKCYR